MTTRRGFVVGALAAGLVPVSGWAEAGNPAFLGAARLADGAFWLIGLGPEGDERFRIPLPERGHAAAAHPKRPEAVAFARRPGRFAVVLDCRGGAPLARLDAPEGRHFYGHGAFSADGRRLFTTENDFDAARGVIGIWDAARGYARLGEFASGGVGPHDIKLLEEGGLVIANGGIETHPDSGRVKLNLPGMRPNLSYVSEMGQIGELVELPEALHRNSIRHLALVPDGQVAFAMQWQGDAGEQPPLLGLHRRGGAVTLLQADEPAHRAMRGYAGSIAVSQDGSQVAITSPKGGLVQMFDLGAGAFAAQVAREDVCGLAAGAGGFVYSTGGGAFGGLRDGAPGWIVQHGCQWDNHLVQVRAA